MVDLTGSVSVVRPGVRVDTEYVVRADADRLACVARMIDDGRLTLEIHEVIPPGRPRAGQSRAQDRVATLDKWRQWRKGMAGGRHIAALAGQHVKRSALELDGNMTRGALLIAAP